MIDAKIVCFVMAFLNVAGLIIPFLSGLRYVTRMPCFSSFASGPSTDSCSICVDIMCLPLFLLASANAKIAQLLASVPPPVKKTSLGAAPVKLANLDLASSMAARALRPRACMEEGFPYCSFRYGIIFLSTSGESGVAAEWSK